MQPAPADISTPMQLLEHLETLRQCILKTIIYLIIFTSLIYASLEYWLPVFLLPIGTLVSLKPTEIFMAYIQLSFMGGIVCALPFFLWEFWKFVSPGLEPHEIRAIRPLLPFTYLLFLGGITFAYFLALPLALHFLLGLGDGFVTPQISIGFYVSFITHFTLAFGILFELPVVILLLTKIGWVTPEFLKKTRKTAIVIIFLAAAILTPGPDVISQLFLAIPAIILFEFSLWLSQTSLKKDRLTE